MYTMLYLSKYVRKQYILYACALFTAVLALPALAFAQTNINLQNQLNQLQNQVESLQSQMQSESSTTFSRNLSLGDSGQDVQRLQEVLNQDTRTQLAASGPGSPGNETTFFGPRTEQAVIAFQELYADEVLAPVGLSEGTGYVGPSTREKLNELTASEAQSSPDQSEMSGQDTSLQSQTQESDSTDNLSDTQEQSLTQSVTDQGAQLQEPSVQNTTDTSTSGGDSNLPENVQAVFQQQGVTPPETPSGDYYAEGCTPVDDFSGNDAEVLEQMCEIASADFGDLSDGSGGNTDTSEQYQQVKEGIEKVAPYVRLDTSDTTVTTEETASIDWDINSVYSCQKTSTGDTDGWSGTLQTDTKTVTVFGETDTIPSDNGTESVSFQTAGDVTLALECSRNGNNYSESIQITVEDPPEDDTDSDYLSLSPSTITTDESATISWDTSGYNACDTSGQWGENAIPAGTAGQKIVQGAGYSTGSYTFSATCEKKSDGETVTDSVTLIVGEEEDSESGEIQESSAPADSFIASAGSGFQTDAMGGSGNASVVTESPSSVQQKQSLNQTGSVQLAQSDSSGSATEPPVDNAAFTPFGGQIKHFPIPCTCSASAVIHVDDSIASKYEGKYLYTPLLTTLHRHYEIWNAGACTLGNYFTPAALKCKQVNPFGGDCFEWPQVDGNLWQIGTSEKDAAAPYCGE